MPDDLRPASRHLLTHLRGLGDAAIGRSMPELGAELELGERTMRRAFRELEAAGFVTFRRSSSRHKIVAGLTSGPPTCRPKPAQTGPTNRPKPAQTGPNRPGSTLALPFSFNDQPKDAVVMKRRARARRPTQHQQQRQLMLDLSASQDRSQLVELEAVLERVDEMVKAIWRDVGRTHGFLCWDDSSRQGLMVAVRRYGWAEVSRCLDWSAHRVAAGMLSPALFATTFRGNAFSDRHRKMLQWHDDEERRRQKEAYQRQQDELARGTIPATSDAPARSPEPAAEPDDPWLPLDYMDNLVSQIGKGTLLG